jgi:hypothetical protein
MAKKHRPRGDSRKNNNKKHRKSLSLGRFGTAEEFNNLGVGGLVYPHTQLGLRPTFSTTISLPGGSNGFFASPYPTLSTMNTNGFDWLTDYPHNGSVVYVPGSEAVNIIASVPYLISAPAQLEPLFDDQIPRESWESAGLDPTSQAPLWRFHNGQRIDLQTNCYGAVYEFINEGTGATYRESLPRDPYPHTNGIAIEPGIDFVKISQFFSCVAWDNMMLAAGRYVFQVDLYAIPRDMAYECSGEIPLAECYRNRHLSELPDIPMTSIEVVGEVPVNFRIPRVIRLLPATGNVGTDVEFSGELLARTNEVTFAPSLPADFQVLSDNLVRAQVPNLAETGQVIVKTARGWVVVDEPFTVEGIHMAVPRVKPLIW